MENENKLVNGNSNGKKRGRPGRPSGKKSQDIIQS